MTTTALIGTLLVVVSLTAGTSQAQERVGDFTLLDQRGNSHNIKWYGV